MAAVLNALPDFSEPLLMHPQRLASKVTQISGQELVHAQVFCDISRLLEGDADEEARSRLEQATRIVRSGAEWRHARGAAAAPPSERAVPKGGSLPSVLDAAIDVARLQSLERDLRASAAPSICVQSRVDVRQALSDPAWADVEAVATWIARWCATRSVKATIYVVDNRPGRLDARETLIVPTDTLGGQGMPLARVAQLTTHAVRPRSLTREGSIYSSDSDILHKVWWGWVDAQLRIAVTASPDEEGFLVENLRALIMPVFDTWIGDGVDPAAVAWHEVPGLADVAALRLLGGFPPDIALVRVSPRAGRDRLRRRPKEDVLVVGSDALAVDRRAAELTSTDLGSRELYAIAKLLDD